ncbi:MAG: TlpA disulfide reductase family protein [Lacipirellulaceae bacterium]
MAHQQKIARSVIAAADAALESKPQGEQLAELHFHRLTGFNTLVNPSKPKSKERFEKAIETTLANPDRTVSDVGLKFYVSNAFARWPMLDPKEREQTTARIQKYVLSRDPAPNYVMGSIKVADFLAESGDEDLAKQFIQAMLPHFAKAKNSQDETTAEIKEQAKVLAGIGRRMNLLGQTIKLSGRTLSEEEPEGKKLDWSKYEGKVVLVDFWATWCAPCRAELPNVARLYEAYHDKGFEVIGVNLDDKPKLAQKFIAQKQLPWKTLYSFDKTRRGWSDPRAVEFGITGIPFAILLDRQGKVIDTHAREQHLVDLLQKELGEPLVSLQASPKAVTAAKVKVDEAVEPVSNQ